MTNSHTQQRTGDTTKREAEEQTNPNTLQYVIIATTILAIFTALIIAARISLSLPINEVLGIGGIPNLIASTVVWLIIFWLLSKTIAKAGSAAYNNIEGKKLENGE